jgi:hypothetical protein
MLSAVGGKIMTLRLAVILAMFFLISATTSPVGQASERYIVTMPELNVFRRPTVHAEQVATWRRNDEVTIGRLHVDDEGITWILACKARECGWVDKQFLAQRPSPSAKQSASGRRVQPGEAGTRTESEPRRAKVAWRQLSRTALIGGQPGGSGVLGAHLLRGFEELSVLEPPDIPGAVVWALAAGGAAEGAGLRMFDVVTRFNGKPVAGHLDLVAFVKATVPGTQAEMIVLRPDIDAAITHFRPQCDEESPQACASLGLLYMAKRDWKAAFQWSSKAAGNGSVTGMLNVANLYDAGLGIQRNQQEAIRWYRRAAEKGSKLAVERLSQMGEPAGRTQWEWDTDRPGLDYHNFEQDRDDPAICQDACQKDPRCRAWTWVKPEPRGKRSRCWLKSAVPERVQSTCCVSGLSPAAPRSEPAPSRDTLDGSPNTVRACGGRPCLQAVGSPSDPPIAMHERARAWAEVVGQIPAGAIGIASLGETAVSASVEWLHVEYQGIRGWVPSRFLKSDANDKPPGPEKHHAGDALERLPPLPKLERLK